MTSFPPSFSLNFLFCCQFYDALLDAEADAVAAKKNLHSGESPKRGAAPTDLSLPNAKERAKSFLSNFTRGGAQRGVVQYVLNGSRVKVCPLLFTAVHAERSTCLSLY